MNLLFVSDAFPYPPDAGVKVRNYHLIRRLAERCQIGLLTFVFSDEEENSLNEMRQFCEPVEVVRYTRPPAWRHLPGVARQLLRGEPLANYFVFRPELAERLALLTSQTAYDVVQIDCTPMAPYQAFVRTPPGGLRPPRKALVFIDVNAHKFKRQLQVARGLMPRLHNLLDWLLMLRWEGRYAAHFDRCIMMSALDERRLLARQPGLPTSVIPNGVDLDEKRPLPPPISGSDILLLGDLTHLPWADGVRFFHEQIFPHLLASQPEVRMLVVGHAPPDIQALASDQVIITGRVPSVEPAYRQARVAVVPLRSGGGTRLKILESLAYGRPVVSTRIGCEGLDLVPGRDLLVADDPEQFATAVGRLLVEAPLWQRLAQQGRRTVEARYGWKSIANQLYATYAELCTQNGRWGQPQASPFREARMPESPSARPMRLLNPGGATIHKRGTA